MTPDNKRPDIKTRTGFSVQAIGFITIARKELSRVFRIWPQTLLPSVVTMTLYFLIFGQFVGEKIGYIEGVSYINFIVPGLIMMAVITNSYSNVTSTVFSSKFQRFIDELLVSPLKNSTILLGHLSGGVMRSFLVSILVTIVACFFTDISIQHPWIIFFTSLLTSLLFCLGGFINAIFANSFDDISIVPTFILTPLIYLGGVFYSIDQLPTFWKTVSLFNPILYLVNAFRYGFLGVSDISVTTALTILCFVLIAFYMIAITLLRRGTGLRS